MDPEGARALAKRIADGPPGDERAGPQNDATLAQRIEEQVLPVGPGRPLETVYVKPRPVTRADVRIYVRGADGRLERQP
jgi:hypothetical protein